MKNYYFNISGHKPQVFTSQLQSLELRHSMQCKLNEKQSGFILHFCHYRIMITGSRKLLIKYIESS